jgi:hypothetical protein
MFLKVMVHLSVIRILRLRSASEIGTAGLVGFSFLLDSGLHVADVTKAPAARDVDGVAPLVTSEGRWAATWAGNLDAAPAASASGLVMLCHSLLLAGSRRLSPSSSSSFCIAES